MTEKLFTSWGNRIKRNGTLLNIEFKTKVDARLCCKLLNQQDNDISYYINHLDEICKWHKEHYGKSILDERLEFKSDCEKENELLKKENEQLKTQIKIFEKFLDENNLDIDWELFCTVDECKKDSDDYGCKECKYLGVICDG